MDFINTSHPNFIGGSKAVKMALQQVKTSKVPLTVSRQKDGVVEPDKTSPSEKTSKSRAILARHSNGFLTEKDARPSSDSEKVVPSGATSSSSWGISSIFGGSDNRSANQPFNELALLNTEQSFSMIHLREPPIVLRPSEGPSEPEIIEIAVTKLLLRSYYDIVRKKIEDFVPKTIMHFLVKHTKRELHNVFIKKLYRENLFEELLQEPDEVAMKRKRTRDTLRVLKQAFRTLDELPLEADSVERGYNMGADPTGLPKMHGIPASSMYSTSSSSSDSFYPSPKNPKPRKSSHSGELQVPLYGNPDSNGNGQSFMPSLYPKLDL